MESYYSKTDLDVDLTLWFFCIQEASQIKKKKKSLFSAVILNYVFSYLLPGTVAKFETYIS